MTDDLDGIATFVAVAEAKGFRAAGKQLGVSGSAVSQMLRRLEERLGVTLVQRTTRSVRLTEAGERLYAAVRPALDGVRAAVEAVGEMADEPRGTVRLTVSASAESFLRGPVLEGFLDEYPHVRLDIIVGSEPVEIVAAGYDAGVRLGEMIDQDMIAVPASGPQRMLVVASPAYLARHGAPEHDLTVSFDARVVTNDIPLIVRFARAGVGLAMVFEEVVRPLVQRGELVEVLREFSTPFPGFYLYYPNRRTASPPLRALIDYLLHLRQTA